MHSSQATVGVFLNGYILRRWTGAWSTYRALNACLSMGGDVNLECSSENATLVRKRPSFYRCRLQHLTVAAALRNQLAPALQLCCQVHVRATPEP